MKKNKSILFVLFICLGFLLRIQVVNAEEYFEVNEVDLSEVTVGEKFRVETTDGEYVTYAITEVEKDNIYIGNISNKNKLGIYHFEIDVYEDDEKNPSTSRKFVKLEELCEKTYNENGKKIDICNLTKYESKNNNGDVINISRQYINSIEDTIEIEENGIKKTKEISREVHYSTEHELGTDKFTSWLYLSDGTSDINPEDTYCQNNKKNDLCFYFGNIEEGEAETKRFNSEGVLTGDVETLIDTNGDIYISLRFLSEALGARVDWLPKKINNDTDAVLIRFYDSESYCKAFEADFDIINSSNSNEFSAMYNKFLDEIKGAKNDMSFQMNYKYRDSEGTKTGTAKWSHLFLSGSAADNGYIVWNPDKKLVGFRMDSSKPGDISNTDFQEICPSENYDKNGQLVKLDGCIEITGLIRYYGVPVPINLLKNDDSICKFDEKNFEEDDNYYDNDNDSDYDYNDDSNNDSDEYETIVVGDIHVQKLSYIDEFEGVDYRVVSSITEFENELNTISRDIKSSKNYKLIFHMGHNEIFNIDASDKTDDEKKEEITELAKKYAKIYSDFLKKVDKKNASKYIIENTPNQYGWKNTMHFYDQLTINIEKDNLNNINYYNDDQLYCNFQKEYTTKNGVTTDVKYIDNSIIFASDKKSYTEDTYKNLIDALDSCIDIDLEK